MLDVFVYESQFSPIVQMVWLAALAAPFVIPPIGRWFNLDVDWDKRMFEKLFGKKNKEEENGNVVPFPELKEVPKVDPPKQEEPAKIYYRLGLTDNNRVAFSMGYSEITMNYEGVQAMIDQLTFFQNQLTEEDEQ